MPTEHKKSKSKVATKVDIKVEAQDVHPLSHYIDDRVELIRQIFMSLKSKTIKSIAPDFLQGKSLETIQEYCLDELLGISTKRLQSIINASQCPENTDSSDSDVENIEEHISLEEISSDSADDALHANKSKAKSKVPAKSGKNGTTETTGSGKKEISVLELLELQARARAIRSQLALEPVTKIELDSDNDSDTSSSPKILPDSTSTVATTSGKDKTNKPKSSSKATIQENNGMQIITPNVPKVKPVRLKRNFRQRQKDDYDPDEDDETKSIENSESKEIDKKSGDENDEKSADKSNEKEKDEVERSSSPDLIPIIQEPETYCISSDSDEGSSSVPKYITYPTVVKENLPETEDEKFLKKIKEGSGVDLRDLIKARRGGKHGENSLEKSGTAKDVTMQNDTETPSGTEDSLASTSNKNVETDHLEEVEASVNETHQQLDKDTEPEEGELTDGNEDHLESNQITILSSDDEKEDQIKSATKCSEDIVAQVDSDHGDSKIIEEQSDSESSTSGSDSDSDSASSAASTFKEADVDDDIIDLGKDEELDFEMKEVEQKDLKNKKKKTKKKVKIIDHSIDVLSTNVTEDAEIIEEPKENVDDAKTEITTTEERINAPADEKGEKEETQTGVETTPDGDLTESDTWQTRWLRGRNVTKVMATSRLANKVRTKIKQKKSKSEQETLNSDSADLTSVSSVVSASTITSTVTAEEGSVQHYEELVAQETDSK